MSEPSRVAQWPTLAVYAALPTWGLIVGPSYAGLVFGLAAVQLIYGVSISRRRPQFDRQLGLLAVAFAIVCAASSVWSIAPRHSFAAALQVSAILAGALLFLAAQPLPDEHETNRLFRVLLIATAAGTAIMLLDRALGEPLQALITGRPAPGVATKYNRGEDYLVLLAWPQLAFAAWRRRWHDAAVLVLCVVLVTAFGLSLAGSVAALAGIAGLAMAFWLPNLAVVILAIAVLLFCAGVPTWLHEVTTHRDLLAPFLKPSGLHRLDIWDYTTSHVMQRPLSGWGVGSADMVPMTAGAGRFGAELYPHNQWLELWVETGALGAAIGLAFVLLLLHRISHLAQPLRPFACAAFTSAVVISCVNFEVTTDSWWAALAASSWLLMAVQHRMAH